MANRYWVGGTAAWDGTAGTKWSATSGGAGGASVPTAADDVFFNAASGAVTVTISGVSGKGLSLNCTGFTGTFAMVFGLQISGSVTFSAGMTISAAEGLEIIGTGTLTTNGKVLTTVVCSPGAAGTVTLGSALTVSQNLEISNGTFTTSASNYAVTASTIRSIATGNVRTVSLNGSTVTGTASGTAFNMDSTNLTFNSGTSTIVSSNGGNILGQFLTFRNITMSSTFVRRSDIRFAVCTTLTLTAPTAAAAGVSVYNLLSSTITTLALSGATVTKRIMLCSSADIIGSTATLTCTSVTGLSDIDFRDIAFNTSRSGTRLGNCGGNTNITFVAAKTVYWNLAGTQSWGAVGWATTSGGAPAANNFPLAQDTAVVDDAGAATQINIDSNWNIGVLDMSARTSALTVNFTDLSTFYGSLTTGSGITYSGTSRLTFANRVAATLTSAGKTFTNPLQVSSYNSTLSLGDAYTNSRASSTVFGLGYGTFDANGYNVTFSGASCDVDLAFTGNRASNATRTLAIGSGVFTVAGSGVSFDAGDATGLTVTGTGTISLTSASAKTFAGEGVSYGTVTLNQGGAGTLNIDGSNSFGSVSNTYGATGATSILFVAGSTTTLTAWAASGTSGKLLTIGSTSAANHTLSIPAGIVGANFLSVSRSTATGGATWYAGANSTNGGNNTGWIFSNPPSGNFLPFFV